MPVAACEQPVEFKDWPCRVLYCSSELSLVPNLSTKPSIAPLHHLEKKDWLIWSVVRDAADRTSTEEVQLHTHV
jgi:predicted DNA-binding protein (MmcQ/YjbR family)